MTFNKWESLENRRVYLLQQTSIPIDWTTIFPSIHLSLFAETSLYKNVKKRKKCRVFKGYFKFPFYSSLRFFLTKKGKQILNTLYFLWW